MLCEKIGLLFKVKVTTVGSSRQYLLKPRAFCNQTRCGDASSWASLSCENIGLQSSRSILTVRAGLIKIWLCFYSANKVGMYWSNRVTHNMSAVWGWQTSFIISHWLFVELLQRARQDTLMYKLMTCMISLSFKTVITDYISRNFLFLEKQF